MIRALALGLVVAAACDGSAGADVFRCVAPDGSVRFVDTPHACAQGQATPHRLRGRIEKAAAPTDEAAPAVAPNLDAVLLAPAAVRPAWDVVGEAPIDPSRDPDLVRWGVGAQRARHYTRDEGGVVQVCSVELWAFEDVAHARAAHEGFQYPGWSIEREGSLLVMVRGVVMQPGQAPRRGVFPDCRRLGERIRARAAAGS